MDEEAIQKMFENVEKLTNKIKKIKKVGDYGINCTTIRESIIYPEIGGMRQDIGLSRKDKIKIEYANEEDNFQINIIFKNESIVKALEVVIIYLSHGNDDVYSENVVVYLEGKEIPILSDIQLSSKLNKEGLKLEERYQDESYNIVNEGVWMNIDGVVNVIKSVHKTEIITLKIKKIEGEDNFGEYMSCIHISFNSKYYEDGYLENLEWKRVDPLLMEGRSNNKQ